MTVYNGRFRCEGSKHKPNGKPLQMLASWSGPLVWFGTCAACGRLLRLYTNGCVVMHKRESRAQLPT